MGASSERWEAEEERKKNFHWNDCDKLLMTLQFETLKFPSLIPLHGLSFNIIIIVNDDAYFFYYYIWFVVSNVFNETVIFFLCVSLKVSGYETSNGVYANFLTDLFTYEISYIK